MRALTAVLGATALLAGTAQAQSWTGPDPKRVPNLLNLSDVDYALSEVCFPFLTGAEPAALEKRAFVVKNGRHEAWKRGAKAYFVGSGQQTVVLEEGAGRSCTLWAAAGDPQKQKAAVLKRLDTWPVKLTLAPFQYPPNDFAERLFLCAPPEGPHDAALISVGGRPGKRTYPLVATVRRAASRDAACDGQAPSAENLSMNAPVAVANLGKLARACRDAVAGRRLEEAFAEVDRPAGPLVLSDPALGPLAERLKLFFGPAGSVLTARLPGTAGFAFVEPSGARCRVDLRGAARFDPAVRDEIKSWSGWRTTGERRAAGPDGQVLDWRIEPGLEPAATVVLEFRRAG